MTTTQRRDAALAAYLVLLLILFCTWQWAPLHSVEWGYDEGVNLAKARLVREGHALYREVWSDQPPLFTYALAGCQRLFGNSPITARTMMLAIGCATLVLVALLARELAARTGSEAGGTLAGMAASLLLALTPQFQHLSRQVMIGLPSVGLALAAFLAAYRFRATQRPHWLAATGVLYCASLLVKPLTVPLFPALCWLVATAPPARGAEEGLPVWWRRVLTLALWVGVPALVAIGLVGPLAFLRQIVGTTVDARTANTIPLLGNWPVVRDWVWGDAIGLSSTALVALAALGEVALWSRGRRPHAIAFGLALLPSAVALMLHTPMRRHQLLLLTPFLAMLAAVAGVEVGHSVGRVARGLAKEHKGTRTRADTRTWALATAGAAALVLLAIELPTMIATGAAARNEAIRERADGSTAIRAAIAEWAPEGGTLIADTPIHGILLGMRIPPELAVPSARRVEAGEITSELLIAIAQRDRPSAIVIQERFSELEAFGEWVADHYCLVAMPGELKRVYAPHPVAPDQILSTHGEIELLAADVPRLAVEAGDDLDLTLCLRARAPIEVDYTLFVQLLAADGALLGQVDVRPLNETYRTNRWQPGQAVAQRISIPIAADAPPGTAMIAIGFYDQAGDGERLATCDSAGMPCESGQIILPQHPVVHWEARYDVPHVSHRQVIQFGEVARLLGYDLEPERARPGEVVTLRLYWQALDQGNTSYTVFVHILDPLAQPAGADSLVAQQDHVPGDGAFPTSGWFPGEVIVDAHHIALPAEVRFANLRIGIGMYDLASGARLPVADAPEAGGRALLNSILVVRTRDRHGPLWRHPAKIE